jgi:hypothetical protein
MKVSSSRIISVCSALFVKVWQQKQQFCTRSKILDINNGKQHSVMFWKFSETLYLMILPLGNQENCKA